MEYGIQGEKIVSAPSQSQVHCYLFAHNKFLEIFALV